MELPNCAKTSTTQRRCHRRQRDAIELSGCDPRREVRFHARRAAARELSPCFRTIVQLAEDACKRGCVAFGEDLATTRSLNHPGDLSRGRADDRNLAKQRLAE